MPDKWWKISPMPFLIGALLIMIPIVAWTLFHPPPLWKAEKLARNDPNGYSACVDMVGVQKAYTTAPAISHLLSASWFAAFSTTPDIYGALQGSTAAQDPIVDSGKLIKACERHGFTIPKSNHP